MSGNDWTADSFSQLMIGSKVKSPVCVERSARRLCVCLFCDNGQTS